MIDLQKPILWGKLISKDDSTDEIKTIFKGEDGLFYKFTIIVDSEDLWNCLSDMNEFDEDTPDSLMRNVEKYGEEGIRNKGFNLKLTDDKKSVVWEIINPERVNLSMIRDMSYSDGTGLLVFENAKSKDLIAESEKPLNIKQSLLENNVALIGSI